MNRHDVDWSGYWPAVPTPFTSGQRLDEGALRELMALYLHHGVHGVLINGSTGEWFSQSLGERQPAGSPRRGYGRPSTRDLTH